MISSLRIILAAVFLLATPLTAVRAGADEPQPASGAPTFLILVRHAEKMAGGSDPTLSPKGTQRAADLARLLADQKIDALYSSQYRRTRLTLEPLALLKKLKIETDSIDGDVEQWAIGFAGRVLARHRGRTVVIAGHSNTVPLLARALGVTGMPDLGEGDYDDLFLIVRSGGRATLAHLHYGAQSE